MLTGLLFAALQNHIVAFDGEGKIAQIRQSWDQASLLKQVDVIGKTGRNWPIRDGADQIQLIVKSAARAGPTGSASDRPADDILIRSRGNSTNILRDPHASLDLFGPREPITGAAAAVVAPYAGARPRQRDFAEILGDQADDETATPRAAPAVISPYAGARPRERSFTEILGDEPEEDQDAGDGHERPSSPTKAVAPKIGAGKHFQPSRLFDSEGDVESNPTTPDKLKSPDRFYRPHPQKFNHFDFADGTEPQDAPKPGQAVDQMPKTKHNSQWGFEDFNTPAKPALQKARAHNVRHWGTENDPVEETPVKKPVQVKPRRDAETHFEFRDDGLPGEPRVPTRPRGTAHNTGLGLYENNLYNEDGSAPGPGPGQRALGNITNLRDRSKIFDPHFNMTDDSPHHQVSAKPAASEDRMKVVKMMESNWASFDESPAAQKENNLPGGPNGGPADGHGIQIIGDGMGGKKGGSGRGWGIGDDSDDDTAKRAVPGKKPGLATQQSSGSFWDF